MYIITNKPEFSIWVTTTPFNKKSGVWYFMNDEFEYNDTLQELIEQYGSKFMWTLKKVEKMYKERGLSDES